MRSSSGLCERCRRCHQRYALNRSIFRHKKVVPIRREEKKYSHLRSENLRCSEIEKEKKSQIDICVLRRRGPFHSAAAYQDSRTRSVLRVARGGSRGGGESALATCFSLWLRLVVQLERSSRLFSGLENTGKLFFSSAGVHRKLEQRASPYLSSDDVVRNARRPISAKKKMFRAIHALINIAK